MTGRGERKPLDLPQGVIRLVRFRVFDGELQSTQLAKKELVLLQLPKLHAHRPLEDSSRRIYGVLRAGVGDLTVQRMDHVAEGIILALAQQLT